MTLSTTTEKKEASFLFPGLTWQQFKTLEPMLDVPGVRLSFLNGVLEIQRMPGQGTTGNAARVLPTSYWN
jgi:Uma2 family endonuclease